MKKRLILATVATAVAVFAGSVTIAAPAGAVGTKNGKCTYYDSFVGSSSARGNNTTSGEYKLCGNVKLRVGYNVSGGSALYTPWKTASGLVLQGPVGYPVFAGEHTVTNPAPAYPNPLIRT